LSTEPELRHSLWDNATKLYGTLQNLGFTLGPEVSPIVAARFDDMAKALAFWNGLLERGVYVNMVLPPATPDGRCLLRCSVSAAHTPEQMDTICQAFTDVRELE
jgi:8-amino-7-oxononanoate synthase